jgi:hypothetical protein
MRKNLLMLVVSVVLFSLFNTSDTNFSLWNTPSINTNYIDSPEIPISFNTDISVLGLVTNFFTKFELDYSVNNTDYTVVPSFIDDIVDDEDVVLSSDFFENVVEGSIIEEAEEVVEKSIIEEAKDVVEESIIEEAEELVEESIVEEAEELVEESIVEEDEDVVEKPVVKLVTRKKINKPIKEVFEEDPLPSDKEIIQQHPNIKENAKKLILEALEEGDITMIDVFDLLNEYAGKDLNKKKVKKFIKKNRK